MSERQEHKKRFNAKVAWCRAFEEWLRNEPSMFRIFAWRKWKKQKPNVEDYLTKE